MYIVVAQHSRVCGLGFISALVDQWSNLYSKGCGDIKLRWRRYRRGRKFRLTWAKFLLDTRRKARLRLVLLQKHGGALCDDGGQTRGGQRKEPSSAKWRKCLKFLLRCMEDISRRLLLGPDFGSRTCCVDWWWQNADRDALQLSLQSIGKKELLAGSGEDCSILVYVARVRR